MGVYLSTFFHGRSPQPPAPVVISIATASPALGPAWPLHCAFCVELSTSEKSDSLLLLRVGFPHPQAPSPPRGRDSALWSPHRAPGPRGPGLGRQACVLRLMSSCQAHSEPLLTDGFGLSDSEAHTARCLRGCGVLVSLASVPQPHLSQGCSGCAGPWQGRTGHRLFAEAREKPWELSPGRGGTGREQHHSFQPKNAGCLPCFSFFTCFSEASCGFQ